MRCSCGHTLHLEMIRCAHCHQPVTFDPASGLLRRRTTADNSLLCANAGRTKLGCNWLAAQPGQLCMSCALTRTVPDQSTAANRTGLLAFERAKRRVMAALLRIGLLPANLTCGFWKLAFDLKEDQRDNPLVADEFVLTGHIEGLITINLRETDSLRAEMTRREFNERYRTLIGSLRHEIGHYFWYVLVSAYPDLLARFRELFGDERTDYSAALAKHYHEFHATGASSTHDHPDYITVYATTHPWEDWAETWAHFMHMEDALSTARNIGFSPGNNGNGMDITRMIANWRSAIQLANGLSVALGHRPAYPFVINDAVAAKMGFIADAITAIGGKPFTVGS